MKVSVCIPTYNQSHYLELAILSAYNQTSKPFEIVVSNDCSTDDTKMLLETLQQKISILKVFHQPTNIGIAKNTDFCLRQAKGDFIVRLDSDDFLHNQYIEKLTPHFTDNPDVGYVHAAVQEVDQNSNFTRQRRLFRKQGFLSGNEALKASVGGYKVAANIIMFSRLVLEEIQYVTGRPDYVEDYHMTTAIAAAGYGNVYVDEILSYYRVWTDSNKVRLRRKQMEIKGLNRVFDDILFPAFAERKWSTARLRKQKANFASRQADCLAWKIYSKEEKLELTKTLAQLSSAPKAKIYAWLYLNNFGPFLKLSGSVRRSGVAILKKVLLNK